MKSQAEDEANSLAARKGNEKITKSIEGLKIQLEEVREGLLDDNYERQDGLNQPERQQIIQSRIKEIEPS